MAWRSSSGVTERALWGLVVGWLLVDFFSRAAVWLLSTYWDTELPSVVWALWVEGTTIAIAVVLALYASRRLAYGGWFIIGLYLVREGTRATASPGITIDDLAFRLYVPLALLAYVLVLLWVVWIASTFDRLPGEARRSWVITLVGAAMLVVAGKTVAFSYVTEFSEATWWWSRYVADALPASLAKAVDFLASGSGTVAAYALLRWADRTARRLKHPSVRVDQA
jgi:hypothetical protein